MYKVLVSDDVGWIDSLFLELSSEDGHELCHLVGLTTDEPVPVLRKTIKRVLRFGSMIHTVDHGTVARQTVHRIPHHIDSLVRVICLAELHKEWVVTLHDEHTVVCLGLAVHAHDLEGGASVDAHGAASTDACDTLKVSSQE